jgi:hypothetical protein
MKFKLPYLLIILICIAGACNAVKSPKISDNSTEKEANNAVYDTIEIVNDSLDYKIIILEIGFNGWLQTQRPQGFYSQQYLENKNRIYTYEYNNRILEPGRYNPNLYPFRIDYEYDVDYGYEVNYLLYHYFLFFDEKYQQNLTRF